MLHTVGIKIWLMIPPPPQLTIADNSSFTTLVWNTLPTSLLFLVAWRIHLCLSNKTSLWSNSSSLCSNVISSAGGQPMVYEKKETIWTLLWTQSCTVKFFMAEHVYCGWTTLLDHQCLFIIVSATLFSTDEASTVQCTKYSTVQYSTVQYSTVQCSTAQYSTKSCFFVFKHTPKMYHPS